jgi:hypothetical protein
MPQEMAVCSIILCIYLAVEERGAQDEALQAYLDKMSELLIDGHLHEKADEYDTTRITARARTLAVLRRLDGKRKRTVLLFLREARLINRYDFLHPEKGGRVRYYAHYVGLEDADLSKAELDRARLISTSGIEPISLKGANLKGAKLRGTNLRGADLSEADLSGADLSEADLIGTDLIGTDLIGTDLSAADLSEVRNWTAEQLRAALHLEGATMPDGQTLRGPKTPKGPTFEDWLKKTRRRPTRRTRRANNPRSGEDGNQTDQEL